MMIRSLSLLFFAISAFGCQKPHEKVARDGLAFTMPTHPHGQFKVVRQRPMYFCLNPFEKITLPAFENAAFILPDNLTWVEQDHFVMDIEDKGHDFILNKGFNQLQARAKPVRVKVVPFRIIVK